MSALLFPTPYEDVNAVLAHFAAGTRAILRRGFVGMYLYGSLALGDFNPTGSDIDFIVVTQRAISDARGAQLAALHERFDRGLDLPGSTWAGKLEAAYVARRALQSALPGDEKYLQVERGTGLLPAPLEAGWAFQLHSLRAHAVTVTGPALHTIAAPVSREDMRRAALAITGEWLRQSREDPGWLAWLRLRDAQAFIALTLCRILYSLATGEVASKPVTARWAIQALLPHCLAGAPQDEALGFDPSGLVERALAGQHTPGPALDKDVQATLALLRWVGNSAGRC